MQLRLLSDKFILLNGLRYGIIVTRALLGDKHVIDIGLHSLKLIVCHMRTFLSFQGCLGSHLFKAVFSKFAFIFVLIEIFRQL